mmetsp:Transcript_48632/g.106253  ORF Transcript_48632/g.106253 Transcript_48632/m.106253 type:complete len:88 (-) Transcript_48632:182-445(-)
MAFFTFDTISRHIEPMRRPTLKMQTDHITYLQVIRAQARQDCISCIVNAQRHILAAAEPPASRIWFVQQFHADPDKAQRQRTQQPDA